MPSKKSPVSRSIKSVVGILLILGVSFFSAFSNDKVVKVHKPSVSKKASFSVSLPDTHAFRKRNDSIVVKELPKEKKHIDGIIIRETRETRVPKKHADSVTVQDVHSSKKTPDSVKSALPVLPRKSADTITLKETNLQIKQGDSVSLKSKFALKKTVDTTSTLQVKNDSAAMVFPGTILPAKPSDSVSQKSKQFVQSSPVPPLQPVYQKKAQAPISAIFFVKILAFFGSIGIIIYFVLSIKKRLGPRRFMTTTRLSVMDKEVQRACRYIEKNFADPTLSLTTLCTHLVTGEAFLESLMKRDLGVTIDDFIAHVRINRAKLLLIKEPSKTAEALALEIGFTSVENFHATFTKCTEVTFEHYTKLQRDKS